ncbi:hypothetical protein CYLTODRAFT_447425 [Cylindrobasidium torrendii FP15055 ss-10]|uniref:Uncharacterized protein n=1 Tax=Cylindrobasidium torrendii FP15055 ss-10 TaxID=1314674 RepID=A0A0D7AW05_9AGAR|nr:hypothetical protein CYLTODRAFT_447425 [Cylindrobasidium torrendii FP15055 ss-10]
MDDDMDAIIAFLDGDVGYGHDSDDAEDSSSSDMDNAFAGNAHAGNDTGDAVPASSNATDNAENPQLNDADDTIVLSDLVRSGEASRLRRRGAVHHPSASLGGRGDTLETRSEAWLRDYASLRNDEVARHPLADSANAALNTERSEDKGGWMLFCGVEEEVVEEYDVGESVGLGVFRFMPSPPSSSSSSSPRTLGRRTVKRKTGCGALVHTCAFPLFSSTSNTSPNASTHSNSSATHPSAWTSTSEASDAVVPLDAMYFSGDDNTEEGLGRIGKSTCGCERVGVGCAVCGNPLGTRYTPCKTAQDSSSPSFPSSSSYGSNDTHPSGPSYWHEHRPSSSSPCMYTFMASAVEGKEAAAGSDPSIPSASSSTSSRTSTPSSSRPDPRLSFPAFQPRTLTHARAPLLFPPPPRPYPVRIPPLVEDHEGDDEEEEGGEGEEGRYYSRFMWGGGGRDGRRRERERRGEEEDEPQRESLPRTNNGPRPRTNEPQPPNEPEDELPISSRNVRLSLSFTRWGEWTLEREDKNEGGVGGGGMLFPER